MAMQEDDLQKLYDEARDYYEGRNGKPTDHAKAAELFRQLAEKGVGVAQALLGQMYENGDGVEKRPRQQNGTRWQANIPMTAKNCPPSDSNARE